jgi:hypothetical protein
VRNPAAPAVQREAKMIGGGAAIQSGSVIAGILGFLTGTIAGVRSLKFRNFGVDQQLTLDEL